MSNLKAERLWHLHRSSFMATPLLWQLPVVGQWTLFEVFWCHSTKHESKRRIWHQVLATQQLLDRKYCAVPMVWRPSGNKCSVYCAVASGLRLLCEKACEAVIVCWSSGETGQVCNLSNVVLCCFIVGDLQAQVWQQSRHGAWTPLRSPSNRAPVVYDRKNRCKRSLISAVIFAEELCLSFVHFT